MRRGIAGAAAILFVAARVALVLFAIDRQTSSRDIDRYFQIVSGGIPYRDQDVEYPPVSVGVLEVLHAIAPGRPGFGFAIVASIAAIEALLCLLMLRSFGGGVGLTFLILDTPLYALLLTRIDAISVALAALYVALALRARSFSAAVVWAAAVGAKLWPFPLGAYLFSSSAERVVRRRALVGGAAAAAVLAGVWFAAGRFEGMRQVLTFRGSRGWQIESIGGSILHLFGAGPVRSEGGASRIGQVPPGFGLAVALAGAAAAVLVCWWAGRQGRPGTGWVTAVMCLLATSTVLSPQFVTWAVPGAALVVREQRTWLIAAFAAVVLLTLGESTLGVGVINGDPFPQALLLMRNAALLATLAVGVWSLARRRGPGAARSGSMAPHVGGDSCAGPARAPGGAAAGGRGAADRV